MSMLDVMLDPIFRLPLITGLTVALVLPVVGAYLLLRDEWLAALGFAHLAAASALLGMAVGLPAVLGGLVGAAAGGGAKALTQARGNLPYAFMILFGWSALILIAANTQLGSAFGHAVVEGQLYFAGPVELGAALTLAGWIIATLPRITPDLMRIQFFPRHSHAMGASAARARLTFDLLAAITMAVGTATVGLMGAFALVLVPAWIAFRIAPGWRYTLALCALTGAAGSILASVAALALDQPFGPVLVVVLLGFALLSALISPGVGAPRLGMPTRPR
jgi:zinc transport system permease protein